LLNLSSLATDCGITQPTAKAWLSVLETSFIAFRLRPWSGNIRKRLVKTPKLQFYDTGLVCWLLGIRSAQQLSAHPLRGAVFETWVASEIVKHRANRGEAAGLFFFRDRHGLESDLLVEEGGGITIVEAKAGQTVTDDMLSSARRVSSALKGAGEIATVVIHGGHEPQRRSDVLVLPWSGLHDRPW
jgi:predicted AAA+ superfamily ATPase